MIDEYQRDDVVFLPTLTLTQPTPLALKPKL